MAPSFDLQGHRGARGLRPENTLSSFEAALDAGVTSIETDLHLTADGVVVLCHDPTVQTGDGRHLVRQLPLTRLRTCRVHHNPDPVRFPNQDAAVTPLARALAAARGFDPETIPTLADLFAFAAAYAGSEGELHGKSDAQRRAAAGVRFDLELKRVPFHPEVIGDDFDGSRPGLLESRLVEQVHAAGVAERTSVRSFDHRCVRVLRETEPRLTGGVLIAGTAPVNAVDLMRAADASVYCPGYEFLDEATVRTVKAAGYKVVPWTVNDPVHWEKLVAWGVDGLTTDYPDRLAAWHGRGLSTHAAGRIAAGCKTPSR